MMTDDSHIVLCVFSSELLTLCFCCACCVSQLLVVGTCWIYFHAVVGLYWTQVSVEGCMLITMLTGCR